MSKDINTAFVKDFTAINNSPAACILLLGLATWPTIKYYNGNMPKRYKEVRFFLHTSQFLNIYEYMWWLRKVYFR